MSQLAVAACACPALFVTSSSVGVLPPTSVDYATAEASSAKPMTTLNHWSDTRDTVLPQLCGEHCKNGQQSERASSVKTGMKDSVMISSEKNNASPTSTAAITATMRGVWLTVSCPEALDPDESVWIKPTSVAQG